MKTSIIITLILITSMTACMSKKNPSTGNISFGIYETVKASEVPTRSKTH